jgi:hypothetical protein
MAVYRQAEKRTANPKKRTAMPKSKKKKKKKNFIDFLISSTVSMF